MSAALPDESAVAVEGEPPRGVFKELSHLLLAGRAALSQFLDLLTLEARRACLTMMWMVILAVVAAVCIVTAWMGFVGAVIIWAIALGVPVLTAFSAAVVINGAAAFALIYVCVSKSRDLRFSATRRRLAGADPLKTELP